MLTDGSSLKLCLLRQVRSMNRWFEPLARIPCGIWYSLAAAIGFAMTVVASGQSIRTGEPATVPAGAVVNYSELAAIESAASLSNPKEGKAREIMKPKKQLEVSAT